MHNRKSLIIVSTLCFFLSLSSCIKEKIDNKIYVNSCKTPPYTNEFSQLNKSHVKLVTNSIEKLQNIDNKYYYKNIKNYCQYIKISDSRYCVLYVLKDNSVGGDFTLCHNQNDGEINSMQFGE